VNYLSSSRCQNGIRWWFSKKTTESS